MQVNGTRLPSPRTSAHPLNGILPLLIAPLITIIIKGLKKPAATTPPLPRQRRPSNADCCDYLKPEPYAAHIGFDRISLHLEAEVPAHVQHHDIFLQHVA